MKRRSMDMKFGDSLSIIAKRIDMNIFDLIDLNPHITKEVESGRLGIFIGQKVYTS